MVGGFSSHMPHVGLSLTSSISTDVDDSRGDSFGDDDGAVTAAVVAVAATAGVADVANGVRICVDVLPLACISLSQSVHNSWPH